MAAKRITFANCFHHTEVTVLVRDQRIAGSTARRIRRWLCGMADCHCGVGECGTRSNAGLRTWIYSDDGETRYDEEPEWSPRGELLGVSLVER